MQEQFNSTQISKVIDQALIYQCACPAQVCRAIFELRELYEYEIACTEDSANDRPGVPAIVADHLRQSGASADSC